MEKSARSLSAEPVSTPSNSDRSCNALPRSEHCTTCSDEALPVTVISVDDEHNLALVRDGETNLEIDITLIENAQPGDTLLIHGGVAIARL